MAHTGLAVFFRRAAFALFFAPAKRPSRKWSQYPFTAAGAEVNFNQG